jgi:hypothetical protein
MVLSLGFPRGLQQVKASIGLQVHQLPVRLLLTATPVHT